MIDRIPIPAAIAMAFVGATLALDATIATTIMAALFGKCVLNFPDLFIDDMICAAFLITYYFAVAGLLVAVPLDPSREDLPSLIGSAILLSLFVYIVIGCCVLAILTGIGLTLYLIGVMRLVKGSRQPN